MEQSGQLELRNHSATNYTRGSFDIDYHRQFLLKLNNFTEGQDLRLGLNAAYLTRHALHALAN